MSTLALLTVFRCILSKLGAKTYNHSFACERDCLSQCGLPTMATCPGCHSAFASKPLDPADPRGPELGEKRVFKRDR